MFRGLLYVCSDDYNDDGDDDGGNSRSVMVPTRHGIFKSYNLTIQQYSTFSAKPKMEMRYVHCKWMGTHFLAHSRPTLSLKFCREYFCTPHTFSNSSKTIYHTIHIHIHIFEEHLVSF